MSDVATFGIDLASNPTSTGVCMIVWRSDGTGWVDCPGKGGRDHDLLTQLARPDVTRVGIDAPFGWPRDFVDALNGYRAVGVWEGSALGDYAFDRFLRWRGTDRYVHEKTGLNPLSVSSDKIGAVAMRCARLLSAYWHAHDEQSERAGAGKLVEVYPAAALKRWRISPLDQGLDPGSYKGTKPEARARRERLMADIISQTSEWLELGEKTVTECERHDDCLDAFVCALIARAVDCAQVLPIDNPELAQEEGWIALPSKPLSELGAGCVST